MQGYLRQAKLFGDWRRVWSQHVWWTREVIQSIIAGLPGTQNSVNKLLQNPYEMGAIWAEYWSDASVKRMEALFTTHLKMGGDIVTAAKAGNTQQVTELTRQWYQNADDIARALSQINPHYDMAEVQRMMYEHLRLTGLEANYILGGQFDNGIATFDQIQAEAEDMADYFAKGLVAQFPDKFR